jgi:hypothetical protein
VTHEFQVAWIKRYTEGDKTYPYKAMRWYAKERKERPLTADEEKTVLWLRNEYGLEALMRDMPVEPRDWVKRT